MKTNLSNQPVATLDPTRSPPSKPAGAPQNSAAPKNAGSEAGRPKAAKICDSERWEATIAQDSETHGRAAKLVVEAEKILASMRRDLADMSHPELLRRCALLAEAASSATEGISALAATFDRGWRFHEVEAARDELVQTADGIQEAIADFQANVSVDDAPPWLPQSTREEYIERVQNLEVVIESDGDRAFGMSMDEGWVTIGRGLLEGIMELTKEDRSRLGLLLVLHEAFHGFQNIDGTSFHNVGRAAEGLEVVDYEADAAAAATAAAFELRRANVDQLSPKEVRRVTREIGTRWIKTSVKGIEAFDRSEQGGQVHRLADRRLQRYMLWHLNLATAKTARKPEHLWQILERKLVIKLGETRGILDSRGDKLVYSATPKTELFISAQTPDGLHEILRLRKKRDSFDPAEIIDAVRNYRVDQLEEQFRYVQHAARRELSPWNLSSRQRPRGA